MNKRGENSYVVAAMRTPVAPRNGALSDYVPHELAVPVIQACLAQADLHPEDIDELILSNGLGAGGNPARLAALAAGLPEQVGGMTVDRQCVGGLDALRIADAMVRSGQADIVVAGGSESYSRRPERSRTDPKGGPSVPYDRPPFSPWPERDPEMPQSADALAQRLGVQRDDQDRWAINSHAKALKHRTLSRSEIVPLPTAAGTLIDDAFARPLTERHCTRAPVVHGCITAANSAVAADGAAFCIVASHEAVKRRGWGQALAILGTATIGDAPEWPGLAPVSAIKLALTRAKTNISELTHAAIMEAFAVQAIACVNQSGLPHQVVNSRGGALARGHPIGASGAIEAVRLFHDLQRDGGKGVAAIAAAGGLGSALVLGPA